jgi:hypothetical protein
VRLCVAHTGVPEVDLLLMDVGESEAEASLASHDWRIPIHILVLVGLTTGVEGNEFRGLLEARTRLGETSGRLNWGSRRVSAPVWPVAPPAAVK